MEPKACPLLSITTSPNDKWFVCLREDCELWTQARDHQGNIEEGCAFRINAMKDAGGKIPV